MKNYERYGSITVNCIQCNRQFKASPSRIKHGRSKFCSRECSSKWKKKAYAGRPGISRFGPDNPRWKGVSAEKNCPICGKPFKSPNKTCSIECGHALQAYKIFKQNGKSRAVLNGKRNKKLVHRVYGKACVICNFDRFVEYAHIIPAKHGGTVHPSNIIPLCPNHHRLMDRNLLTPEEDKMLDDFIIMAWASEHSIRR